jgi:hypothetical protein
MISTSATNRTSVTLSPLGPKENFEQYAYALDNIRLEYSISQQIQIFGT